ncbi:MAG: hypothetical protein COW85_14270 [Ignavibacteria bacterium CG22_combo_CG10-13_8_21_14_all_37_15]|nr:MAG: hypothetical protein COW85_14270 [Ignavibacteria bacterium CG22_combo_CG10-13_8_21_14_all_37_15]
MNLKIMNLVFILVLVLLGANEAQSQNNSSQITLSNKPSAKEIGNLFYRVSTGELDIFTVLPAVIAKKEKAVHALEDLLSSPRDTIRKEYLLMALDGISSKKAVELIIKTALTERDVEVRGSAVRILAMNQYGRAVDDTLGAKPDKEILHVLYACADDTAMAANSGGRIGEIAREGIKNWTGKELGNLPLKSRMKKDGTQPQNASVRHEKHWQKITPKLKWDSDEKHFKVKE